MIIPGRDELMGFCKFDEGAKTDKLEGKTAAGMTAVDAYPLLGTMMHVGVTNLVQMERTGQHDMMLSALVSSHGSGPGAWCAKTIFTKWAFPNFVPACVRASEKSRLSAQGVMTRFRKVPGWPLVNILLNRI